MAGTLRDALVNWLRPAELIPTRPAIPAAYGSPTPYRPALEAGSDRAEHPRDGQPWPLICEQIALRVLAASYQLAEEVEAAEAGEEDQGRLERLYRIDHAVTRIRRQAEILQVLSGRPIEDVRRQVTSVLDVIRAAASAVDHYQRLHIGHTVDLAVVDFAADDLIRMLTELLDNAAHFAPPAATAMISAHLTESGSVLLRLEDRGVGVPPEQLLLLNELLCGGPVPTLSTQGELRLGLQVVAKLAAAHGMGVSLFARPGGGLTATILVPAQLVCEVPVDVPTPGLGGAQRAIARPAGAPPAEAIEAVPADPPAPAVEPAPAGHTANGLPRRVAASLRAGRAGRPSGHGADGAALAGTGPVPDGPAGGEPGAGDRADWSDEVAGFAAAFEAARDGVPGPPDAADSGDGESR